MCNQPQRCSPVVSQPIAARVVLAAMIVMMSDLTSQTGAAALDKSWTTGGYAKNQGSQSVRSSAVTNVGSLRAERLKIGDHTTPPWDDISLTNVGPAAVVSARSDTGAHRSRHRRATSAHQNATRKKSLFPFSHKNSDLPRSVFSGVL
jgi:hypothetical protein